MNELLEKLGAKIKKARQKKMLSQKNLAEKINCKQPLICKIEKGQVPVNLLFLQKIERELNIKFLRIDSKYHNTEPDTPAAPAAEPALSQTAVVREIKETILGYKEGETQ